MGLCTLVFQPVITLIQVVVAVIENVLVLVCTLIQELVSVIEQVLQWICNTVVQTVCGAVCGVVCGICDFFCGIFGCDCGCENVCNNVCNAVTQVVCGWTYVLEAVLELVTQLICNYILQAILILLNLIEAIVTMILTWVCSGLDWIIRWFLCWTYIAELFDGLAGDTRARWFRVAPRIVPNAAGYSDWFVFVNNADAKGTVDQTPLYILSDQGRPLLPVIDRASGEIAYYEVETHGNHITGGLRRVGDGEYVTGEPFLWYPYKVMEIASHLFGDIFASQPGDDGTGSDYTKNLFTYLPNVQAWLSGDGKLTSNNYNAWSGKYKGAGGSDYFGDGSNADMGMRVDTDSTCSHPTNTLLSVVNGGIDMTPPDNDVAQNMTCGTGQTLKFDETNFLLLNKYDSTSVTSYFVSQYNLDDSSVGCNDLLGYTIITFEGSGTPIFVDNLVLEFSADTNHMMARIVENVCTKHTFDIVRVAETYLHESGHQCGLLHDTDPPGCANPDTLNISKLMNPGGNNRRAYTRWQWCMIKTSSYITDGELTPFVQAPELPDSGSVPGGGPR